MALHLHLIRGSPPQVRGKRHKVWDSYEFDGITPAGAGKTPNPQTRKKAAQDHPRRCGENGGIASLILLNIGSPPQVRGKHICTATVIIG